MGINWVRFFWREQQDVNRDDRRRLVFIRSGFFWSKRQDVYHQDIFHRMRLNEVLLKMTAALSENPFQLKTRDRGEQSNCAIKDLIIQSLLEVC